MIKNTLYTALGFLAAYALLAVSMVNTDRIEQACLDNMDGCDIIIIRSGV